MMSNIERELREVAISVFILVATCSMYLLEDIESVTMAILGILCCLLAVRSYCKRCSCSKPRALRHLLVSVLGILILMVIVSSVLAVIENGKNGVLSDEVVRGSLVAMISWFIVTIFVLSVMAIKKM